MHEKGQKESLRASVVGGPSYKARYINIHIYIYKYVDIPDPQTHFFPLQLIASSAAVWSMGQSQHDSSGSDFPWLRVTSQEAPTLGKPKPNCGYCKTSVRTCTSPAGLSAWCRDGFSTGMWWLYLFTISSWWG